MGWKGVAIGGYVGSLFGGPLGAILGAVLGHKVEERRWREKVEVEREGGEADAYTMLGASAKDDAETLKRKYRELAKRNHPDALRAQGLPEEMVSKATERMSRINEAWATIKEARGV